MTGGSGPGRFSAGITDSPPIPGSLAVTGGTVVTPAGPLPAEVVIEDGRIAALARPGSAPAAADRLDATGCLVLPGGVDPHCHIMPDVAAATRAAALGGTTTLLSFTSPGPGEGTVECVLRHREELADGRAAVDVGLHAMCYQPDEVPGLTALRDAGVSGIKVFLAYSELGIMWSARGLFELMTAAARCGQVVQVHCEEGELIDGLAAAAVAAGRTGARVFAETRPPGAEAASVARVLETAHITGATSYLVHLSCAGALDQVRLARRRGAPRVHAEVCLHHLLLDDRNYLRDDAERYLVCPPLRPPGHQEALWHALADGTLDTVGSDHCQERSETIGEFAPDGQGYRLRDRRRRGAVSAAAVAWAGAGRAGRAAGRGRLREPGTGVRPLPAQGSDRPRVRRRPADLGSRRGNGHHGGYLRRPHRRQRLRGRAADRESEGRAARRQGAGPAGPFRGDRHSRNVPEPGRVTGAAAGAPAMAVRSVVKE